MRILHLPVAQPSNSSSRERVANKGVGLRAKFAAMLTLSLALVQTTLTQPAQAAVTCVQTRSKIGSMENVPVRQWFDNNVKTKGVIVAVHGAVRHSGTFTPLAEQLASQGFLVASPDLRGHGDWYFDAKDNKDKVADYDGSTEDVVALLKQLHAEHPLVPIFCMGESAGAVVALRAAAQYPTMNGLVLSSIGTRPCVHDVQNLVPEVFTGLMHFNKPLGVTKVSMRKYSSDDERVRTTATDDPMLKPGMSAHELLKTAWLLNHTNGYAKRIPDHIPVLMLQGKEDQIVEASSAVRVLKHISSKQKKIVEFPCGHILLSTPFLRDDVVATLTDWLTARTSEQQTAALSDRKDAVSAQ